MRMVAESPVYLSLNGVLKGSAHCNVHHRSRQHLFAQLKLSASDFEGKSVKII
jgi:hypothetical protein